MESRCNISVGSSSHFSCVRPCSRNTNIQTVIYNKEQLQPWKKTTTTHQFTSNMLKLLFNSQAFWYRSRVSPQTRRRFGHIQLWGETPAFAVCTLVTTCIYWEDTVAIKVQLICVFFPSEPHTHSSSNLLIPGGGHSHHLTINQLSDYNLVKETGDITGWVEGFGWLTVRQK